MANIRADYVLSRCGPFCGGWYGDILREITSWIGNPFTESRSTRIECLDAHLEGFRQREIKVLKQRLHRFVDIQHDEEDAYIYYVLESALRHHYETLNHVENYGMIELMECCPRVDRFMLKRQIRLLRASNCKAD